MYIFLLCNSRFVTGEVRVLDYWQFRMNIISNVHKAYNCSCLFGVLWVHVTRYRNCSEKEVLSKNHSQFRYFLSSSMYVCNFLVFSDSTLKDSDWTTMPMLQEYIDAVNGLPDNLYSKGLLKDDECFRLAEISSYEVCARDMLDLLNPRMENGSGRKQFSAALIETDQRHVYNYLTHCKGSMMNLRSVSSAHTISKFDKDFCRQTIVVNRKPNLPNNQLISFSTSHLAEINLIITLW